MRSSLGRLTAFLRSFMPGGEWELIVVDDGSRDATAAIAREFARSAPRHVRLVRHPRNRGLAAALESGAAAATYPLVVIVDADLSYAPETVGALVAALRETGSVCALASPYMRGGHVADVPFSRLVASVLANRLLSWCAGGRVKTLTGMVRAYDARILRELLARRGAAEFNSWSVAMMLGAKLPLVEVPARLAWPEYRRRTVGRMTASTLRRRTAGVLRSAASLLGFERGNVLTGKNARTFVPPELGDGLMSRR